MIKGLFYYPKFLLESEGATVLKALVTSSLGDSPLPWKGVTHVRNSRRILQYGFAHSYSGGPMIKTSPIPEVFNILQIGGADPDQLTINEYLPGQGISDHVDHIGHFGPEIACITVGSGCEITFKSLDTIDTFSLYVEPNSLYVLTGDARYRWTHAVVPRKSDVVQGKRVVRGIRYSLTYRTLRFASDASAFHSLREAKL